MVPALFTVRPTHCTIPAPVISTVSVEVMSSNPVIDPLILPVRVLVPPPANRIEVAFSVLPADPAPSVSILMTALTRFKAPTDKPPSIFKVLLLTSKSPKKLKPSTKVCVPEVKPSWAPKSASTKPSKVDPVEKFVLPLARNNSALKLLLKTPLISKLAPVLT